ncbi:MAG: hypothetical protein ACLFVJ_16800 [Persicimonas sp.]
MGRPLPWSDSGWESFECLVRVLEEHFEWSDEPDPDPPDGKQTPESAPDRSLELRKHATSHRDDGTTLQSPYDPDAAKGHKGVGYMVHISGTCLNEELPEILTDFRVETANQADQDKSQGIVSSQQEQDVDLSRLYGDAGYTTATALEFAAGQGVELCGPFCVAQYDEKTMLGRADFEWTEDGQIKACPAGHEPVEHRPRTWDDQAGAAFIELEHETATNFVLSGFPHRTPHHVKWRS